ncbi:molybdenum ABC transporter ATP-binding protein [Falsirhodobacter algicola]|uniref:Molybdenum ABC transporter ATP-binding protein n=1 Tax=Falsirhodobacter algicola TaxID=2692330 RepID=A0A8J8MRD4_9RHOB|nr:molybdenum ABC transporter ATP-binding protein [Falsirhodobacter algicola]QUS35340.1 molybdenum ABC transporter ATP-binding protein [Falsirhodobacter algicola]
MTLDIALRHRLGRFDLDIAFASEARVTTLFGPSGAGKTTVAQAVAGLLRPKAGHIHLNGSAMFGPGTWVPPHRRKIGYVFQDARLFPHMTVRANLLYGNRDPSSLGRIADLLGIGPLLTRRPARLSGGERQRVAIGRALLSDPALLIMDEPLSALDPPRRQEILPYLEHLRDGEGPPILYISHSVAEIARLSDRVILLEGGRVRGAGTPAELLADAGAGPLLGAGELGALLQARIEAKEEDGLTRLSTAAGLLWLVTDAPVGRDLRVRIQATDVMLSRRRPEGLSALNILPARVETLPEGGATALVGLRTKAGPLLASVTARSIAALDLRPGVECFAILKAAAVEGHSSVGGGDLRARSR